LVRVEMLAVGKELLIGRTMNSNALWVGKRLARMGSMLKEITTVDDDLEEIGPAFRAIVRRSPEFLVVVGGLGPTPDDMTLKGIAGALGVRLKRNEAALRMIREHYRERGLEGVVLTPARLKMSRLPEGAEPLKNVAGTAPGARLMAGETTVFCLPGVPAELRSIFTGSVEPEVRARLGKLHRKHVTMKIEGVLESALAPALSSALRRHPAAYIKSHPRGVEEGVSRIELDIAVVGEGAKVTADEGEAIAREMKRAVVGMGGTVKAVRGLKEGRGWT
jgi:molybdenum cofactor synthesis domain-containing protein